MTLWTVAGQAPLSMGFSREGYWSGLPCLSLGNPPNPGINPASLVSLALAGGFFTISATWEAQNFLNFPNLQKACKPLWQGVQIARLSSPHGQDLRLWTVIQQLCSRQQARMSSGYHASFQGYSHELYPVPLLA